LLTALTVFASPAAATLYSVAKATNPTNGRVIVYRFVDQYDAGFEKAQYPVRITIRWKYKGTNGMPVKAANVSMIALEDALEPVLEKDAFASLAIVRTGNDLREWIYYAKSKGEFQSRLNRALAGKPVFPIEMLAENDPEWAEYEDFTSHVSGRAKAR